jgi:hypothetical protein
VQINILSIRAEVAHSAWFHPVELVDRYDASLRGEAPHTNVMLIARINVMTIVYVSASRPKAFHYLM